MTDTAQSPFASQLAEVQTAYNFIEALHKESNYYQQVWVRRNHFIRIDDLSRKPILISLDHNPTHLYPDVPVRLVNTLIDFAHGTVSVSIRINCDGHSSEAIYEPDTARIDWMEKKYASPFNHESAERAWVEHSKSVLRHHAVVIDTALNFLRQSTHLRKLYSMPPPPTFNPHYNSDNELLLDKNLEPVLESKRQPIYVGRRVNGVLMFYPLAMLGRSRDRLYDTLAMHEKVLNNGAQNVR